MATKLLELDLPFMPLPEEAGLALVSACILLGGMAEGPMARDMSVDMLLIVC